MLDAELPDVRQALADAGALRFDPLDVMPPKIADREPREGDERFVTWTARRSTIEHVVARAAEAQDGLEIRRGVTVAALEPRVRRRPRSVRTDDGERLTAELVVDAMGRGSALPRLLGAGSVHERTDDGGFLYYTRYFRGELPAIRGPITRHHGTYSILTLPADDGTWSVTSTAPRATSSLKARARRGALDRARAAHRPPRPLARRRADDRRDGDGRRDEPHARRRARPSTALVSLGDAWACTNPAMGRGMSLRPRARRAAAPCRPRARRPSRRVDGDRSPPPPSASWRRTTARRWPRDRARLAEIDALLAGEQPPPANPLVRAMPRRRATSSAPPLDIIGCLALPQEVFARPASPSAWSRRRRRAL